MNWSEFLFTVSDWVQFAIVGVVRAGFYAALLAAVVLPINVFLRCWITAGQMSLLWALVLVRLVVPVAPASPLSLQNLFTRTQSMFVSTVTSDGELARSVSYHTYDSSNVNAESIPPATESTAEAVWECLAIVVMIVWPIAGIGLLTWTFAVNWRFSRKIERSPRSDDERLLGLWRACCREAGVRRTIPVILSDAVVQPAIMGVFRVRLLLPADTTVLNDDQLRMVMLHELAHVRRWDVAMNWGLAFIRAVQWWNPIYWLAAGRFQNLREQACDAFVLRHLSGQTGRDYGDLLLTLAARTRSLSRWRVLLPTPMLGFILSSIRRRAISCRLRAMPRAAIRRGRWHTLAIAVVTLLLALCGLTDAGSNSTVEQWFGSSNKAAATNRLLPYTFVDSAAVESAAPDEPLVTREYDVAPALRGIAGTHHTLNEPLNQSRLEFEDILRFTFEHFRVQKTKQTNEALSSPGAAEASTDESSADRAGSIRWEIVGDHLKLTATASQHEYFAKELLAWEQVGLAQICIECRFIGINQPLASAASIPWRYVAPFSPDADDTTPLADQAPGESKFRATARVEEFVPVVYAVLDPQQARRLVAEAQVKIGAQIVQAPKITLFTGQQASVAETTQQPFVVAVHEIAGSEQKVNQPTIAIANEGTKITLRPTLRPDRSTIQFNSRLEMSRIDDVGIARVDSHQQGSDQCTIQVLKLKRLQIDIAAEMKDGNSLLIGSPSSKKLEEGQKANNLFILLTPSVIAETLDPFENLSQSQPK
jgi:bla regulator protein blaR1